MAYNEATMADDIASAGVEINRQSWVYDFISQKVIPRLLMESYIRRYTDKKRDNKEAIDFVSHDVEILSYAYTPERLTENAEMMRWSDTQSNFAFDRAIGWENRTELRQVKDDINRLSFVPTSPRGDELIICPDSTCMELQHPFTNERLVDYSDTRLSGESISSIGSKNNKHEYIKHVRTYNDFSKMYFLYDILSKSGLTLGSFFKESYFVIPEMDKSNLCKEVPSLLPYHPKGCFENPFKVYEDLIAYSSNLRATNTAQHIVNVTYLHKYNQLQCCQKLSNGQEECSSQHSDPCYSTDMMKSAYMDAMARDYLLKKTFEIEKKIKEKWSIYKIKLNPELVCKYARPKKEFSFR
jgi:hypothetical protein